MTGYITIDGTVEADDFNCKLVVLVIKSQRSARWSTGVITGTVKHWSDICRETAITVTATGARSKRFIRSQLVRLYKAATELLLVILLVTVANHRKRFEGIVINSIRYGSDVSDGATTVSTATLSLTGSGTEPILTTRPAGTLNLDATTELN